MWSGVHSYMITLERPAYTNMELRSVHMGF